MTVGKTILFTIIFITFIAWIINVYKDYKKYKMNFSDLTNFNKVSDFTVYGFIIFLFSIIAYITIIITKTWNTEL